MLREIGIEGVYVIHALKGYEQHETRLVKLFNDYKFDFELVTAGDPSLDNQKLKEKYFIADIGSTLSEGVMSCTLNHIIAYEKIVENEQSEIP